MNFDIYVEQSGGTHRLLNHLFNLRTIANKINYSHYIQRTKAGTNKKRK